MKQEIYSLPINSKEQLRDRIMTAVHQTSPEQYLAAIRDVRAKFNACIATRSQHFKQYFHQ